MKNKTWAQVDAMVLDQAAEWVVKMNSDHGLEQSEEEALHLWLSESPSHEQCLLHAAEMFDETCAVFDNRQMPSSANEAQPTQTEPRTNSRSHWLLRPQMAMAACLILAVLAFNFFDFSSPRTQLPTVVASEYSTSIGEYRQLELNDGSQVMLNTNSRISVAFDDHQRRLILEQGEAYFDVASNAQRPFIVQVGDTEVRAVGTAFNIEHRSDRLEVIVTHGVVAVSSAIAQADQETVLNKGQMLKLSDGKRAVDAIPADAIEQTLSWQTGRLFFNGEPLNQAVKEIARYTTKEFVFADQEAGLVNIGGSYNVSNINELMMTIGEAFAIDVDMSDRDVVILSSKKSTE